MRRAIVMAGGQGSRLWPLTQTRPKPLVPVANRPIMAYILEWLRGHGLTEVLVTLHYRADEIQREFGDGRSLGVKLTYRVEDQPLGTAGSVKHAEDWVGGEPFVIVSGDALTDLDLTALIQQHRETGAWLTLGLKRVRDSSEYGVVELDDCGRVTRFQEKPRHGRALSNLANTGIYCVEPQVLERIPAGQAYDWSHDVFPQLMAEELPLFGYALDGYWCDIGSMKDYRRGQRDALTGVVRLALPGLETHPGVRIGPEASIAPGAIIEGPVLVGAGCRIDRDALVLPGSILGDNTVVRAGACVWGATVGAGCQIGPDAVLRDCVLDDEVRIEAGAGVVEGAVVGRGCCLAAGVRVGGGQRIEPDQWISDLEPTEHPTGNSRDLSHRHAGVATRERGESDDTDNLTPGAAVGTAAR